MFYNSENILRGLLDYNTTLVVWRWGSMFLRNDVFTYQTKNYRNSGHHKWSSISSTDLIDDPTETLRHLLYLVTVHSWWMTEEGKRAVGCLGAHLWTVWSVFCSVPWLVRKYVFLILLAARKMLLSSLLILLYHVIKCRNFYTNWMEYFVVFCNSIISIHTPWPTTEAK
jgi:hypothetical protein